MKILLLDIETAPNLAYVWGLWKQTIDIKNIVDSSYVLCWSAKWLGEEKVYYHSVQHSKPASMLERIHRLLNEADAVIHYNGKSFDIPTLNKEFLLHGLKPPAPYKQIDLLLVCRDKFRFPSNKLNYVSQALKLGAKAEHEGFDLWVKCMAGDKDAWKRMETYNRQDVILLEKLYDKILPWIGQHPSRGAFDGDDLQCCTNCGSEDVQSRGYAVTRVYKYRRYQCRGCGHWLRGNKTVSKRGAERLVTAI
jgi:DNA polymerase elongation subunit (family B)